MKIPDSLITFNSEIELKNGEKVSVSFENYQKALAKASTIGQDLKIRFNSATGKEEITTIGSEDRTIIAKARIITEACVIEPKDLLPYQMVEVYAAINALAITRHSAMLEYAKRSLGWTDKVESQYKSAVRELLKGKAREEQFSIEAEYIRIGLSLGMTPSQVSDIPESDLIYILAQEAITSYGEAFRAHQREKERKLEENKNRVMSKMPTFSGGAGGVR